MSPDQIRRLVVGKVIELLRAMKGISQAGLSSTLNTSQSRLSRIEKGTSEPKFEEVRILARELTGRIDTFYMIIDLTTLNWTEDLGKVESSTDDQYAHLLLPWSAMRALKAEMTQEFENAMKRDIGMKYRILA